MADDNPADEPLPVGSDDRIVRQGRVDGTAGSGAVGARMKCAEISRATQAPRVNEDSRTPRLSPRP